MLNLHSVKKKMFPRTLYFGCNFLLHYLQRPPAVADEDKKDQQKKKDWKGHLESPKGKMILIKVCAQPGPTPHSR